MKTLIVYYSLTGMSRKVAELLQKELNADLEEVKLENPLDINDGTAVGRHVRDSWLCRIPKIEEPRYNPSEYDLVIMGAPMWAFKPAPPIKAYIMKNRSRLPKDTALYITYGGAPPGLSLWQMKRLTKKRPKATLAVREIEIKSGTHEQKVREFAKSLKAVE